MSIKMSREKRRSRSRLVFIITEKQKHQFNNMLNALKQIKAYQSPDKLRKESKSNFGLSFEEAIEMAYENMQFDAAAGCKNVRPIKSHEQNPPKEMDPIPETSLPE